MSEREWAVLERLEGWPIDQQYSELKTELRLDHFEGRTYSGWNRHMVLGAIAHAFLQASADAGHVSP